MMPQKKILIVEDNNINREMLREILTPQYEVLEAAHGEEALAILQEKKEEISLILLDIVMPVMDGYTFLNIAKKDPSISAIPVIVTTQSDSETDEVAALAHGASDYVAKPYNPQVILHRVASIIHLRETAAMINQFQYDQLTGLYSKQFFYQKVYESLTKHPDRKYEIICSDIENFKLINDIFGLPTGDRLLQKMADVYRSLVGENGICCRVNADQFACLTEHRSDYGDQLFAGKEAELNELAQTQNVVVKWGIYEIKKKSLSVEQMCDRAFLAARSIKGQYGKYFAFYDETLRNKLLREQAITDSMETALAEEQFQVYLQPKYEVKEERLAGAEALVRWDHPQWGFLSPGEFIPLFEKNGFITKLDWYVGEKVCGMLHQWRAAGYPLVPISVNVSRADIYQVELTDMLMEMMDRYDLPYHLLHLEITESAYTEDPEQIIHAVRELRELGFVIEMDDFGTGYSSLNMLNEMPLDVLKLDMKFIQNETAKTTQRGILYFIMGLARRMDLAVVAEGVETSEQLEYLREIGCDYVQGFYFAKPMPCKDFEKLLVSQDKNKLEKKSGEARYRHRSRVILVIDEDGDYRNKVHETFGEEYQILEAADAESAVAFLVSYEARIAAVILSLTLPDQKDFSLLKLLQKEKSVWHMPVIATGPPEEALEEKALEMGADEFAFKPHSQKSLKKRLLRLDGIMSARERERILLDEASRDYLTGILNRRGLDTASRALRPEDFPMAVFLFDLDNMKRVNDNFGHVEGDRMLQMFGAFLTTQARGTDLLSRYGGDEFVVIMKKMGSPDAVVKKGSDICRDFRGECMKDEHWGETFTGACSAGVAIWENERDTLEEMIIRADQALYIAKMQNKGGCCLWKK